MGSYKTICPRCSGNDYSVFDNGSTKCWNCGYFTRDTTLYRPLRRSRYIKEIRDYYKEMADYYHSNLTESHRVWLHNRGISDWSINTLKLGYCPGEKSIQYMSKLSKIAGLANKENFPTLSGRITFPFFAEGKVTDMWGRSLDPAEEIRYKGAAGSSFTRGADYAYCHDMRNTTQKLIRTEGIIKTVIANQYGFPCVGDPGTTAHRIGTSALNNQQQIIVYDNQLKNRRNMIQAIRSKASRFDDVLIATLPLRGKDKQDIDSFILTYGIDEFRRVIDGALPFSVWLRLYR